jgi:ribonuclease III
MECSSIIDTQKTKDELINNYPDSLLDEERVIILNEFIQLYKLPIHDIRLLDIALTHSSFANSYSPSLSDNERLEWLGDSVLGLITACYLVEHNIDHTEGALSEKKALMVSEPSLHHIAKSLKLETIIRWHHTVIKQINQKKQVAILADTMEAIIGALYLDTELNTVANFVIPHLIAVEPHLHKWRNYKSPLQSYFQKQNQIVPIYKTIHEEGPAHNKIFTVVAVIDGKEMGLGTGSTRKSAEQAAAKDTLENYIGVNPENI